MSTAIMFYIGMVTGVSLIAFILMGLDKYRAVKGKYRISELTFIALAFFGGAAGVLLGMVSFHHKISKKKFYIGVPVLYIFNQLFHVLIYYRVVK